MTAEAGYDAVIIGAGVAGCAAALSLPPGTRALLVDRRQPGAERCCGGLLAPDAQKALRSLGLTLPDSARVRPEPQTVVIHDLDCGRSQSYHREYVNVDRGRFDSWLIGLVGERAEVRYETRFGGLEPGGVLLRSGRGTTVLRTRLVIGADGAGSAVRRAVAPNRAGPPLMLALQARVPCPDPPDSHVVLFSSALTSFYAWAIPKEGELLIGCAFPERTGARQRFEKVLEWYSAELGLGARPVESSARYLSRPEARSHLFAGRGPVLLAGEAAGLVSPSSGEGISFALLSGAAAGRAAGAAAPQDAYADLFAPLTRRIQLKTAKARVIYSPATRRWAMRLPWCP